MTRKPTYEELEQRVKELEKEAYKRKQAEVALLESEKRFSTLIQRIQAAVVVHRADTSIAMSNRSAQILLGLTEDQMLGKTTIDSAWIFFREDNTAMPHEEYPANQVISTQEPLRNFTTAIYRPSTKDTVWVLVNADPVFDDNDELSQVIITFMDITKRKQAEEALRESEEKYSNLFHFSNDGIFLHDLEGNILDINQKALDQLGYAKSEMLSFKIPDFHPPEALEKSKWAFETIIREGFVSFETDFKKKTGEVFPAEVSSSLFEIGDKKVIQGIVRDITERKLSEKEREKFIKELQEALKEIKTLRGILPLCSYCKKIRDDKGYWEQVDVYIYKHLQADISHSLCPDCAKEHYHDLDIHE
jgi:PAS domain S-box-containing protein